MNTIKLVISIIGVLADIRNGKLPNTSRNNDSLIQLTAFLCRSRTKLMCLFVQTLPTYAKVAFCTSRSKSESSINMTKYAHMHKWVQLRSALKHSPNWMAATWPSRHLCYRPAVFFRHLRDVALSLPQGNIQHVFA